MGQSVEIAPRCRSMSKADRLTELGSRKSPATGRGIVDVNQQRASMIVHRGRNEAPSGD